MQRSEEHQSDTSQDILYVGRYDWSFHFSNRSLEREFQEWAEPVIGPIPDTRDPNDYSECNVQKSGYFIAVDEANFGLDLVAAYKRDCERVIDWVTNVSHDRTIEKMLRKDDMDIGTYLSMAYTGDESGKLQAPMPGYTVELTILLRLAGVFGGTAPRS